MQEFAVFLRKCPKTVPVTVLYGEACFVKHPTPSVSNGLKTDVTVEAVPWSSV